MAAAREQSAEARRPAGLGAITRENHVLRELVTIYHHLTGLALQSSDLATVIELLAQRMTCRVAVVSPTLEILAAAGPEGTTQTNRIGEGLTRNRLAPVLRAVTQTRRALRLPAVGGAPSSVVAPILVGEDILAYLLTVEDARDDAAEDTSLLVTEHAATICGVIMGRERVVAAAAGRVRDDLLEGLLLARATDAEEARRWAQHLGYDPSVAHQVLAVTLEGRTPRHGESPDAEHDAEATAHRRRVFDSLERFIAGRSPAALVGIHAGQMVILAPEPTPPPSRGRWPVRAGGSDISPAGPRAAPTPTQLAGDAHAHARRTFPETVLTIGVGGRCRESGEVARAYAQARRTIETARRLGRRGQVVAFEDLGLHRLLLQVPDLGELRSFADEVIGPLSVYERKHNSGYLRTFAIYLRENGSLQRAARELHVHPNTVTYRLNRVQEITGLDLGRYQDRLMAQVALEILEALGDGR
jgi:PucR C-terminal helix-turn-helix domain/GGDEF-like domain